MKIVIDEKIPFIKGIFEPWADVVYSPGRDIDAATIYDADALIVRTRTRCDSRLLEKSRVRIIASATIGFDHLDTVWLDQTGIKWVNAPGCNSGSVMQYITAALLFLASRHSLDLRSLTLGVVGVGHVGTKVVRAARALGMSVLLNDPPREREEGAADFSPLEKLLEESDILTLHVPLTHEGEDRTRHLINGITLGRLRKNCILINTSRGEVVDNTALRKALEDKVIRGAVLDVWEGEPEADRGLLALTEIATPHIAGYSVDGKANATVNSVREVAAFLGIPLPNWTPDSLPQPAEPVIDLARHTAVTYPVDLAGAAVRHSYRIREDDSLFRGNPEKFEYLRDNYQARREFGSYTVRNADPAAAQILSGLGFRII
ncbi:MAG: 4-phosphoerythronate dehydrogenase PdxB [Bacteroidales bacterium]|nr:4-phosphoerythronate dehydrogenase PdxB [Bacteroidales bacterium]